MGSSRRRASSMIRMIFSTVRAPHEPAFTVGSLAMTATGRPWTSPDAGDHAVRGEVAGQGVHQQALLGEPGALVEEQREPLPDEELSLLGQPGPVALRAAGLGPADGGLDAVLGRVCRGWNGRGDDVVGHRGGV